MPNIKFAQQLLKQKVGRKNSEAKAKAQSHIRIANNKIASIKRATNKKLKKIF